MSGNKKQPEEDRRQKELIGKAEQLLAGPDLLEIADNLIERLGLCGEEVNRRVVFLSGVGGHLGEPIHINIHGASSGGKNMTASTPLRLLPPKRVLRLSGLSEQALAYHQGPIEGVLLIDEAEGLKHADYALRVAMSEGRVARMTVNKGAGGRLKGETREVAVTASIITTTTALALHAENQTRVFDLWIDESEEQTRRVLETKARQAENPSAHSAAEEELELWHTALGLLSPVPVAIPFARKLAERFPCGSIRARRDYPRCLSLIRASALLHQRQRQRTDGGEVVATLEDYRLVYPIIQAVLEPSMSGLTEKALRIADLHKELLAGTDSEWIYRADLEREANRQRVASAGTVHSWCMRFSELGFWEGCLDRGRWKHRSLRDPRQEPISLPTPDELAGTVNLPNTSKQAIGRFNASDDSELQQSPNETSSNQRGKDLDTTLMLDFSDDTDWEAAVSEDETTTKTSQSANCEPVGPCEWCGLPQSGCDFCMPSLGSEAGSKRRAD